MAKITKQMHIDALRATAMSAISYVGRANYSHREAAAKRAVAKSAETGKYVDPEKMEKD